MTKNNGTGALTTTYLSSVQKERSYADTFSLSKTWSFTSTMYSPGMDVSPALYNGTSCPAFRLSEEQREQNEGKSKH